MSVSLTVAPVSRLKGKKKTKKSSQAASIKHSKNQIKGLQISWSDLDPESDSQSEDQIFNRHVTHTNPVRRLVAKSIWDNHKDWILNNHLTWAMRVDVVYESNRGPGVLKKDTADFKLTFKYHGNQNLDAACRDFIRESRETNDKVGLELGFDHKSYGRYIQCDFTIEVVGV